MLGQLVEENRIKVLLLGERGDSRKVREEKSVFVAWCLYVYV
jgi:hypothetical protein